MPIKGARCEIAGAQRINAVNGDVSSAQKIGKPNDVRINLLALLIVHLEFDARTGEERPSRRNPQDDFASGESRFAICKLEKSAQGELETFDGTIDAGGAEDGMETDVVFV